jgi:predicted nuclease of predicted toxin-antitoxin system
VQHHVADDIALVDEDIKITRDSDFEELSLV